MNFAIYSTNFDRILLLDNDLWPLMHTAKLLSSKLSLCVIGYNTDLIINEPCINWTCNKFSEIKMDKQSPRLSFVKNFLEITENDPIIEQDLVRYHEFSKFVLKIVKVSRYTDFLLNSVNHTFYDNILKTKEDLIKISDDSGIDQGLLCSIDQFLFLENDKSSIMNLISEMFENKNSYAPTWLKNYKNTFFDILEKYEKNNL